MFLKFDITALHDFCHFSGNEKMRLFLIFLQKCLFIYASSRGVCGKQLPTVFFHFCLICV